MQRRNFLATLAAPLLSAEDKPNLVLLFGDDLGRTDLGCYGGTEIPTPHLDALAKQGTRFTDSYVSCPYCSPTRAGMMTGRYQTHFGHEFNPGPAEQANENFGLPLTETTMAQRLKTLGYRTGLFGKWHLGYRAGYQPLQRGFDEFYGFLGGAHSYLDAQADAANPIYDGDKKVESVEYTTDVFARRAVDFIERHQKQPFFAYVPFNAVHGPLQALKKYEDRFPQIADPKRRTYAGMLSALDDGVGTILQALDRLQLTRKTLVVFLSDNGGPTPVNTSRNDPLRGVKAQVYEGGFRIPWMMRWPGKIPAGKVYSEPVIALDLLPTFVAAAGGHVEPGWKVDGVDLTPYLNGKKTGRPHEQLYWRFGRQWAMREGDWKLTAMNDAPALYNLPADIGEAQDLSASQPERVKAMTAAWQQWDQKNQPARWVPQAQARKKGNRP